MAHYIAFHCYGNGTAGFDPRPEFRCNVKIVDGKTPDQALVQELINVEEVVWPLESLRTTGRDARILDKYRPQLAR